MSDLLTAKDVEIKAFKKVKFGGYSIPEVEDFLNQVAEDIEAYSMQLDERDSRIQELETFVKKQEAMTDAIKDALIQARKAAKDIEEQAKVNTEKIIADAQAEAEQKLRDADERASVIIGSAEAQAANLIQTSQDKRVQAEETRASIEQELEAYRNDAKQKADVIINNAKDEAKKIMTDAEREIENYEKQLQFLSLQKQQFVKNTLSLLFEFGEVMDKAQQEIDDEMASMPINIDNNNNAATNSENVNASVNYQE